MSVCVCVWGGGGGGGVAGAGEAQVTWGSIGRAGREGFRTGGRQTR